jgi:parallel beta-helix repeat protein
MMRRTIVLLATMALTVLVASGMTLAVTKIGSAGAQSSIVGPGESIQKAVNAAHPGDTIVVRGVHKEDVVIRKDGIKLRGEDAVIQAPTRAKADSPCSMVFGPEAICVLGDVNLDTGKLTGSRVSDVSVSGFTIRGFKIAGEGALVIDVEGARNTAVVGNRITGNAAGGIAVGRSDNTTITKNHVIGNPETDAIGIVVSYHCRNTKILNNEVRNISEGENAIEVNDHSVDTTIAGNDLENNVAGILNRENSTGTKILSNDISRSGIVGIYMTGPKPTNAKVVGNDISGAAWGIFVEDAHGGSFTANTIHDNCAGMFFDAFESQPVADFEVKGNTVENNTRSCRAGAQFDSNFSGIGIALIGASGMELTGNHLSGNIPSGPTPVSGGVVVSTDRRTPKPMNNTVIGNHFGRNKPDIFWDKSGSGNRFVGNLCNTSVPSSLCN